MFLLHLVRWLKANTVQQFDILVRRGGPLEPDFAAVGRVLTQVDFERNPSLIKNYALVYSNTVCNGLFLAQLNLGDVPVITHAHELDFGIDANGARNFAEVVRHTSRYVVCAQAVAHQLVRRFRIKREQIDVHYEMFDPVVTDRNAAAVPPAEARRSLGIPSGARIICACGTVDQRKGADLFVQFAARMTRSWRGEQPLHFVWIGKSSEQTFAQLLGHDVRRAGLTECFHFAGEQANPHALLQLAEFFCLMSREDPFPLVMLEASALGKPMLCFDGSGGAAELCALGAGISVPFLDVAAMAEKGLELLSQENVRREVAESAACVVRQQFVPDVIAPRLWSLIQEVASRATEFSTTSPTLAEVYAGWAKEYCPQPSYVQAALGRERIIQDARKLVQRAQSREAAKLLIRAISTAIDKKDATGMVEAILEFGFELATIDPAKSISLLTQVEQILKAVPATLDIARVYRCEIERIKAACSVNTTPVRVA